MAKELQNFRVSDDLVCRTVQGEEVIVDLNSGTYFGLNESGTFIWKNLLDDHSEEEIAERLAAEYDISPGIATKDTQSLVKHLESQGFVERV